MGAEGLSASTRPGKYQGLSVQVWHVSQYLGQEPGSSSQVLERSSTTGPEFSLFLDATKKGELPCDNEVS